MLFRKYTMHSGNKDVYAELSDKIEYLKEAKQVLQKNEMFCMKVSEDLQMGERLFELDESTYDAVQEGRLFNGGTIEVKFISYPDPDAVPEECTLSIDCFNDPETGDVSVVAEKLEGNKRYIYNPESEAWELNGQYTKLQIGILERASDDAELLAKADVLEEMTDLLLSVTDEEMMHYFDANKEIISLYSELVGSGAYRVGILDESGREMILCKGYYDEEEIRSALLSGKEFQLAVLPSANALGTAIIYENGKYVCCTLFHDPSSIMIKDEEILFEKTEDDSYMKKVFYMREESDAYIYAEFLADEIERYCRAYNWSTVFVTPLSRTALCITNDLKNAFVEIDADSPEGKREGAVLTEAEVNQYFVFREWALKYQKQD